MSTTKTITKMNTRKIKLALTVGLVNTPAGNVLQVIKEQMQNFSDEVGRLVNIVQVKIAPLDPHHNNETYDLQFERCRLTVDLISNADTQTQVVHKFQID